ncbi:MAG: 50S ribosomal protein L3 [Nitrospirae bacterium]|nr:MAG: 50S ribosomal protein L3 [Nitrospirota bacterium]
MDTILGRKLGMTRIFTEDGRAVPVTVVAAGPCTVVQRKSAARDGYDAVQLGYEPVPERKLNRPELGHFKAAGVEPMRVLQEVRVDGGEELSVGDQVTVAIFSPGDKVKVTGRAKGRGFQGVVKRHNFKGGRKTHGSHFHRAPGSIGASAYPSRVQKGRKLPGHMGDHQVSVRNLEVVEVDPEENLLLLKGAVPGARNGLLRITRA